MHDAVNPAALLNLGFHLLNNTHSSAVFEVDKKVNGGGGRTTKASGVSVAVYTCPISAPAGSSAYLARLRNHWQCTVVNEYI